MPCDGGSAAFHDEDLDVSQDCHHPGNHVFAGSMRRGRRRIEFDASGRALTLTDANDGKSERGHGLHVSEQQCDNRADLARAFVFRCRSIAPLRTAYALRYDDEFDESHHRSLQRRLIQGTSGRPIGDRAGKRRRREPGRADGIIER